MTRRLGVLGAALVLAAGIGAVSVSRVRDQLAALEICEASARGDWPAALAGPALEPEADATGRAAVECRCRALLASGRAEDCAEALEQVLGDDAWAPSPELSVHLIQTWRERGRGREAAELARRAGLLHPQDPEVFAVELAARSGVDDEASLLGELEARLPAEGAAAPRMRVGLAGRHLMRGDAERALHVLGETPPEEGPERVRWFETRGHAFAAAGDLAGVQGSYDAWRRAGGPHEELFARYALTLSLAGLADPRFEPVALLEDGFAASAGVGDPALREALAIRWVLTLVAAGRRDEALAVHDALRGELELAGLSRDELERSAAIAEPGARARRGELAFHVSGQAPGDELWLSPEPELPPDSDYERLPVPADGPLVASRGLGEHPARWVYRDAAGRVRASGTLSPVPGRVAEARIRLGEPLAPQPARLARAPGDGVRRVVLVLPDCGDWRLVNYLRARGELPLMEALLAGGYRAVLTSDPPLTATALEALVFPERSAGASFVGWVHQMGFELAGLSSIGENPFDPLTWLLPEERDLFAAVGAAGRRAANLLLSHGGIRAGRHGEITGPGGERRLAAIATSARDLGPEELRLFPELAALEARDAVHVRTIAAELDAAAELAGDRSLDLVMLRIEPLDILTHAHFAEAARDGQDDGRGLLYAVYRYIDARLAETHDRLDEDDVLVVMSDHGIRTAMEHAPEAVFVAAGGGVPAGRAPGSPALRGVPRVLGAWLGIATSWPDTGVASWAGAVAATPLASPGAGDEAPASR